MTSVWGYKVKVAAAIAVVVAAFDNISNGQKTRSQDELFIASV